MPSSLAGKTICFTGTLQTPRAQATAAAKAGGATVSGSVSQNTDILVAGPGAGSKLKAAEAKGVEVWSEDDFNAAIGGGGGGAASAAATKKQKAKKAPASQPPAKKAKKKAPAAQPAAAAAAASSGRERRVMACVPDGDSWGVHGDYDAKLMFSESLGANSNKFYRLQLLEAAGAFAVATNWGRLGEPGQSKLKPCDDEPSAIKEFEKAFRGKTKNVWGAPFERHEGKYQLVETEGDDGDGEGGGDAALGRLSEAQINKGQAVLLKLRAALAKKKTDRIELGQLSNDFYSLIPTTAGRQRPPPLDNVQICTEKEGLLEFWLRMGFDDLGEEMTGSPIEGVLELPLPKSLAAAAGGIADSASISASRTRGAALAAQQAGGPVKRMGVELYAAILLYTGNAIYSEINRCLRADWKKVRKYWQYLRIYFEAMQHMPKMETKLWRGIAFDLFDEYEVGKEVTWWSISSCTASKPVAEGFMNQMGGGAASLITLNVKTACDISSLSHYPHEAESLLLPGTKLRVLSRKRGAKNVALIEVEEVVE
jgi:predicted DNA-binding WGR domain protein